MTELKPCPFCNGRAELKHYIIKGYEPGRVYYVECSKCGQTVVKGRFITTGHSDKWAINKAIEAWNTRPDPWHTGIPTEEGMYVVFAQGGYDFVDYSKGKFDSYSEGVEAWQLIKSYKEAST